jgi:hypothetical protein
MLERTLEALSTAREARLYPGCTSDDIALVEADAGIVLPESHRTFLMHSDGAETYGGYYRLFGARRGAPTDLRTWNSPDFWKFAWGGLASEFFCFGESAWGDQFAYRASSMTGGTEPEVYMLHNTSMLAINIAENFSVFLSRSFLRSAINPFSGIIIESRNKFGDIGDEDHLILKRSILLDGENNINNIALIGARASMIINGDLATEYNGLPDGAQITGVRTYEDEHGRIRVAIEWRRQ